MRANTSFATAWQHWSQIGLSTYKAARRAERRGNIEEAKELLKEAAYSFDRAAVKILRQISAKEVSKRAERNDLYPVDNEDKMWKWRFKKLCHYENTCKRMLEEKFNEGSSALPSIRKAELHERAGEFLNAIDLYGDMEMPEKGVGVYLRVAEQPENVFVHHFYIKEAARYARKAGLEEQARALYGMMIEECGKIEGGKGLERAADLTFEVVGDVNAAIDCYTAIGNGRCLEKAANLVLNEVGDVKMAEGLYRRAAWAYLREDKCPIPLLKRSGIAEKAYRNLVALGKSEKAGWLCSLVEDYSRFPSYKIPRKMDSVVIDILTLSETPGVAVVESKEVLPVLQ